MNDTYCVTLTRWSDFYHSTKQVVFIGNYNDCKTFLGSMNRKLFANDYKRPESDIKTYHPEYGNATKINGWL